MKSVSIWLLLVLGLTAQAQEVPPSATITEVIYRGTGCDAESARVSMTQDFQYLSVLFDRFSAEVGASIPARHVTKNCAIIIKFDLPAGWSFQFEAVEYRGFVALPNQNTIAQQMIAVVTPGSGKGRDFQQNVMRGPKMENFTTIYRNQIDATPGQMIPANNGFDGNIQSLGLGNFRGNGHWQGGHGQGPGNGKGKGGPGKVKRTRRGDMFACSDRVQNSVIRLRSRISVTNAGDPARSSAQIVVDSADASFTQKLKINWHRCLRDN